MKTSTVLTFSDSNKNLQEAPRRRLEMFFGVAVQPYGRQDQSKQSRGFLCSDSWDTYSDLLTLVPEVEKREKGNTRTETRV